MTQCCGPEAAIYCAVLCCAGLGWAVLQMVEETEGASGVIFAYLVTAVGEALSVCRESVLLAKYYLVCFSAAVVEQIPVQHLRLRIKQSRDQWSRDQVHPRICILL